MALLAALFAVPAIAAGPELPAGFHDVKMEFEGINSEEGLYKPTKIRFAPGPGDEQVFIALKDGRILLYESMSDKTPTMFADLRTNVFDLGDRGILGLALDPEIRRRPALRLRPLHL